MKSTIFDILDLKYIHFKKWCSDRSVCGVPNSHLCTSGVIESDFTFIDSDNNNDYVKISCFGEKIFIYKSAFCPDCREFIDAHRIDT